MYIYEMIDDNGICKETCVTFKLEAFKQFLLDFPGRYIEVTRKTSSPANFRLVTTEDVDGFFRNHPDVDIRVDLGRKLPKLLIVGHARHGKDTVVSLLMEQYGIRGCSSSDFATEHVIMPHFAKLGKPYATAKECHEDRVNHRALWYDLIVAYNGNDLTRIAREILMDNDAYCGMRNRRELWACQNAKVFDHVIWVDATDRLPLEGNGSMTIQPWMADIILDNNGHWFELEKNLLVVMNKLGVSQVT